MIEHLQLPERLGFQAARDLHAAIMSRRGTDLTVDGGRVRSGGALAAQILVAAAREWRAAGKSFVLSASTDLLDDLERLGVLAEVIRKEAVV